MPGVIAPKKKLCYDKSRYGFDCAAILFIEVLLVMFLRKVSVVAMALCLMLTVVFSVPSMGVQAMTEDVVVITASSVSVRRNADPTAAELAKVSKNSTFPLMETATGTDGAQWYRIFYSETVNGWVSSVDSVTDTACSTANDPATKYLHRTAQVTAGSFELKSSPGGASLALPVTVSKGEHMAVLDHDNDINGITWFEVRYGGETGWIKRTAVIVHSLCTSPSPLNTSQKVPVIYLSPSRQPANLFAVGNTNECEQMTRVAEALTEYLRQNYECVVYLADYAPPISKYYRPLDAYNLGADIYLAIHSNAGGGAGHGYGTQAYYFPGSAQNKTMASNLVSSISAIAPFTDDAEGIYNGMKLLNGVGYGEVRDPGGYGMISCLLEVEFHDHADSAQWIIDNTDAIAVAIAEGLDKTFSFKDKSETQPTISTTSSTTATTSTTTTTTTTVPSQDGYSPLETTVPTTVPTVSTTATTTTTIATTSTIPTTSTTPAPTYEIIRANGTDRIDTAMKISEIGWDDADKVIIASGSSYPDALAGVPLSRAADAPILLTMSRNGAEDELLAEIARLGAKSAYILGGQAAVSSEVESDLKAAGVACTRLAGNDRYETSVAVAQELKNLTDGMFDTLYFVSADNYPDALAISSIAAIGGDPILYVGSKSALQLCVAEFAAGTGCSNAVLLGGEAAVSDAGKVSIEELGMTVERISGADRYATGLAVAQRFSEMFSGNGVALATGKNFPDALAGGAHAAKLCIPVVLTDEIVGDGIRNFAARLTPGNVYVYGGQNAVNDAAAQAVLAAME